MKSINYYLSRIPNWSIYLLGAAPVFWQFWLAINNRLGADPIDRLIDTYGIWALQLLVATLAITPLRALGIQATKLRRPLGVLTFFYALAHLLVWIVFDQGLALERIITEIIKRPFITLGMISFLIMIPLALTSNNRSLRKLGPKTWGKLHRLTYPLAVLVSLHFILVVKGWPLEPFIYAAIIFGLLAYRLPKRFALTKGRPAS